MIGPAIAEAERQLAELKRQRAELERRYEQARQRLDSRIADTAFDVPAAAPPAKPQPPDPRAVRTAALAGVVLGLIMWLGIVAGR